MTEDDINERSRCDDEKDKPKSTLKFNSLEQRNQLRRDSINHKVEIDYLDEDSEAIIIEHKGKVLNG